MREWIPVQARGTPTLALPEEHSRIDAVRLTRRLASGNCRARLPAASHGAKEIPGQCATQNRVPKTVRILPPISARFIRARRLKPHFAKTYENPVGGTACRKTDEFPAAVTAALIGRFSAFPRNV
jgi:hypothetical protein